VDVFLEKEEHDARIGFQAWKTNVPCDLTVKILIYNTRK
jgi:hypothetical protein